MPFHSELLPLELLPRASPSRSRNVRACRPERRWHVGDCRGFDWDGIKRAWNDAVISGIDPDLEVNNYCLETPDDPSNSEIKSYCLGLFHGCISLEEREAGLLEATSE
jgi:hypothetical protein